MVFCKKNCCLNSNEQFNNNKKKIMPLKKETEGNWFSDVERSKESEIFWWFPGQLHALLTFFIEFNRRFLLHDKRFNGINKFPCTQNPRSWCSKCTVQVDGPVLVLENHPAIRQIIRRWVRETCTSGIFPSTVSYEYSRMHWIMLNSE